MSVSDTLLHMPVLSKRFCVSRASITKAVAWLCGSLSTLCASSLSVKNNSNNNQKGLPVATTKGNSAESQ